MSSHGSSSSYAAMKSEDVGPDIYKGMSSLTILCDSQRFLTSYHVIGNVPELTHTRTIDIVLMEHSKLSAAGTIAIIGTAGYLERKFQFGLSYGTYSVMKEKILSVQTSTYVTSRTSMLDLMKFVSFSS